MHLDVVPCKTERAREALQRRDGLPRGHRLFLIMVDGRKSLRELAEPARQLGIDPVALAALVNAGLIQWQRDAAPPGEHPAPVPVAPVPVPPVPEPPVASRPMPSLAAAKMYALDLVLLMLPAHERELREAAREVTDAQALRRWVEALAGRIAERAGRDRAEVFLARVGARLPAGFLDPVAAP